MNQFKIIIQKHCNIQKQCIIFRLDNTHYIKNNTPRNKYETLSPIPESDNECPFKITVTFDKQNLTDKLMPKLKLLRPKIIFLNGFTQSIVSGIDIVCYLFHKTIRSITYAILIFALSLLP